MDKLLILAAVTTAAFMYGFANFKVSDTDATLNHYCKQVADKTWPDFKGTFEKECKDKKKEVDNRNRIN